MISAFFVFNHKGEVLLARLYRPTAKRSLADGFRIHVISASHLHSSTCTSPITTISSPNDSVFPVSYYHIQHKNLYIVACTNNEPRLNILINIPAIYACLNRFVKLGNDFTPGKLDDGSIKAYFTTFYAILDDIIDHGYPQAFDPRCYEESDVSINVSAATTFMNTAKSLLPRAGLHTSPAAPMLKNQVGRGGGVKHRRNEVFIDIIENVNILASATGDILQQDVTGKVVMKAHLSGYPECRFGLNDRVLLDKERAARPGSSGGKQVGIEIDDFQFHQCVRLGKFESDRSITFVPPEGEFDLMTYRTSKGISIPFDIKPKFRHLGATQMEYKIYAKALFTNKDVASHVVIRIPTPANTLNVHGLGQFRGGGGKAKYNASERAIIWKIPRFQALSEYVLNCELRLTSSTVRADPSSSTSQTSTLPRPAPISVTFTVQMFTASGLMVRFLKIYEPSNYQSIKWVRYMTRAGSYQIRF